MIILKNLLVKPDFKMLPTYILMLFFILSNTVAQNADKSDWEGGRPDGCTTIMVGRDASTDSSVPGLIRL